MSEKQKTYHLMILDKSGSMNSVRDVTIDGLNEQLNSIRQAETDFDDQEQIVCFVTFNGRVDTEQLWDANISDVPDFSRDNYSPCGGTALLDAIGMGIGKLREQIQEELTERKANVVVTIFTDGHENASSEYRDATIIRELVEEIGDTGQWTVAFVGCGDEDVYTIAQSFGIARGNTMAYSAGTEGTTEAFTSMSNARYMRSQDYSQSIAKGIDTADVNNNVDFFAKVDLDDEPPEAEKTNE